MKSNTRLKKNKAVIGGGDGNSILLNTRLKKDKAIIGGGDENSKL